MFYFEKTAVTVMQPCYGRMESGAKGLSIFFQTSKVLQLVYT